MQRIHGCRQSVGSPLTRLPEMRRFHCAAALVLLVASSAQGRYIVLTNQEDGTQQTTIMPGESEQLGGVSPLAWLLKGMQFGPGATEVAPNEVPQENDAVSSSLEDMLRHVRCSRLRASLQDYMTSKRLQEPVSRFTDSEGGETITQDDAVNEDDAFQQLHTAALQQLKQRSIALQQHASLIDHLMGNTEVQSQDDITLSQQQTDDLATQIDNIFRTQFESGAEHPSTQEQVADQVEDVTSGNSDMDWDEEAAGEAMDAAYEAEYVDSQQRKAKANRAREAEELYKRDDVFAGEQQDGDAVSTSPVISGEDAAEMQRDLDGMLGHNQVEGGSTSSSAGGSDSMTEEEAQVGSLVTHLLRGMAVAAQATGMAAADAVEQAAAAASAASMQQGGDGGVALNDLDLGLVQQHLAQQGQGQEEQQQGMVVPHHEVLVLYPYDAESDDVFAFRGELRSGGSGRGAGMLLLSPFTLAAHMVQTLAARMHWALLQDPTMTPYTRMEDRLDQEDEQDFLGYPYGEEERTDEDGADVGGPLFPLTAVSDDPLFLSSWWGPMPVRVADIPAHPNAPVEENEWALVRGDGQVNLGVALLCMLLLATAAMAVGFVRSLWSLRRVMRQQRREMLVPFLVEGQDGTYQQGYMLVDESQLDAATAAGLQGGKGGMVVAGGKGMASPTGGDGQGKAEAQAAWAGEVQRRRTQEQQDEDEEEGGVVVAARHV